jgi:hypothetical protein
MTAFPKTGKTVLKAAKEQRRKDRVSDERTHKRIAKRRDGYRCRFPLCGCHRLKRRLEVSHDERHKGMGGDPRGLRSAPETLITLCVDRHQDSRWSIHKGTIRTRYLTPEKCDGPVAWDIKDAAAWHELAREGCIGVLERLTPWQRDRLRSLAEMDE